MIWSPQNLCDEFPDLLDKSRNLPSNSNNNLTEKSFGLANPQHLTGMSKDLVRQAPILWKIPRAWLVIPEDLSRKLRKVSMFYLVSSKDLLRRFIWQAPKTYPTSSAGLDCWQNLARLVASTLLGQSLELDWTSPHDFIELVLKDLTKQVLNNFLDWSKYLTELVHRTWLGYFSELDKDCFLVLTG